MSDPAVLCWSGGKDGALALGALRDDGTPPVRALLTTFTEEYDRVSMHGIRRPLVEAQARSVGLPLHAVFISREDGSEAYAEKMRQALWRERRAGVGTVAFGDLLLEDVRAYREARLAEAGMAPLFPLWGADTRRLAHSFLDAGFRAVVTCVDTDALDGSFSGRAYDGSFLEDLPEGVDPCGENGEFHTFVADGPVFAEAVPVVTGARVLRDGRFLFTDLLPAG